MSKMPTQCIFITLQVDAAMFYRVADPKFGFSNTFMLTLPRWGKVRSVLVGYREHTDSVVYMEVTTVVVEKGELPGGTYLCQPTVGAATIEVASTNFRA